MTFRPNDGDRDKFKHSLHHYPIKKFDQSLHYYPQRIVHTEQKYYEKQRKLECNSLEFNGSSSYIHHNSFLNIGATNLVSMGAWIYPTEANRTQGIMNSAAAIPDDTIVMRYGSGNVIQVLYWNTLDAAQVVSGITTITLNKWQHWAFTLSGNNVKIYLNSILEKEENKTGTLMQDTDEIDIGRYANGSYFKGFIKKVFVYSRDLSSTEIFNIRNNLPVSNHNLALDLPLKTNSSTDTTVKDFSGNNNDGTLTDCEWNCDWIREKYMVI